MKRFPFVFVLGGAVFTALVLVCFVSITSRPDLGSPRPRKSLSRAYGEGLSLSQHGLYGVDLISCGKVRVEKKKVGFVSIGGLNELVVEDLEVVLPGQGILYGSRSEKDVRSGQGANGLVTPRDVMRDLGLPKVSSIRISNLQLYSLDAATNRVLRLSARSAESNLDGLSLRDCVIMREKNREIADEANLQYRDGRVRVTGEFGVFEF